MKQCDAHHYTLPLCHPHPPSHATTQPPPNTRTQAADLVHSAESLQHNIAGRYQQASAALNAQLQQQLSAVVQYPMPRWPVYVYFAGACVCLLTSCVCHLLGCCQRHISQVVWRFDYAGIAVLIVASFYPAVYYAFLCQPYWRNFYLVTTTIAGARLGGGAGAGCGWSERCVHIAGQIAR